MSPKRTVTFGKLCAHCPLRDRCTTARDGRSMSIHPHEQLLRAAREQARTPEFKQDYPQCREVKVRGLLSSISVGVLCLSVLGR